MAKPIYKTTLQDTTEYGKGSSDTLKLAAAFPNSPLYQANAVGDVAKDSNLAYLVAAPVPGEWGTGTSAVSINNFFFSGILDATVKFVDGLAQDNAGDNAGKIVSPYFPGGVSLEYADAPNLLGGKDADSSTFAGTITPTSPSGPFVPNVRVGQTPAVSAEALGLSQNSSVTVENMPNTSDGISNPSKTSSHIASSLVTDKNNGELGNSGLPS